MEQDLDIREFTELIEENQGIIFKVSGMYCDNEACRQDLFQDILLQLWKSYPSFNKKSKFSSWMYRVALNTAFSQFRTEKKNRKKLMSEIPSDLTDDSHVDETREEERILHHAIGRLKKTERMIIILYMDDYPYVEISEIIGISVSNVGVKINRIKSKLQTILEELGYGL